MYDSHDRWQLRGRGSEVEVLDRVLRTVREGRSAVLVVRGEAGIGKTALLEYLAEEAAGCRVARATGVEAEMELAFATLHQLCGPLLDRRERLPEPQREALATAFGISAGPAPDRFLLALAALNLLAEVAEDMPLVCLIDDAQWLDRASAQCLAFVARRVLAESVALVFAMREPSAERDLTGLPELQLKGLRAPDARALLEYAIAGRIDGQVRDRILAETRGNPLALLELHKAVTAAELAGGFGLVDPRPLATQIEDSFAKRVRALPSDTQLWLLAAAAEPIGDPALLSRAAEQLGIAVDTAAAAEESGLVEFRARVRFRHPLVRSAVYRMAAATERQRVHSALAEATDAAFDPDRRAWHRAAAAPGPDETVAAELERSARRAQRRGGTAAAGAFLARAAELTPDPARRSPRALAAAEAEVQAGAFEAALALLNSAETGPLDDLQRARIELLRGRLAFLLDRGREAPRLLFKAAQQLQPLDIGLSRETFLEALIAAMYGGRFAEGCSPEQVGEAVLAVGGPATPARPADLLLEGLALLTTSSREVAVTMLKRAVDAFRADTVGAEEMLRWLWLAPAAMIVWDHEALEWLSERQVHLARETGALGPLSFALSQLATLSLFKGDLAKAASLIAESGSISSTTGVRRPPYAPVLLAALRGRAREADDLMQETTRDLLRRGEAAGLTYLEWARATLYNGLGRYEEALAAARRAEDEPHEFWWTSWVSTELVEAAVRSGKREHAHGALERLVEDVRASGSDWALGVGAMARALLAGDDAAESLYQEGIERLENTPLRFPLARAYLLYGEWLRRVNRRVDSRVQLRAAHDLFTSIGMEAFAERARLELLATGETARRRTAETRDDLTAQERQIAEMAADGLSNPEIGARLFLSPRTVEWHLRKVFTKLGIRSRHELATRLPSPDTELSPT